MSKRNPHKRRPVRFSKQIRHGMMVDWKEGVFPIVLLIHGPPPRRPDLPEDYGYDAMRDWGDATNTYYNQISKWYRDNYLVGFSKPKLIIDRYSWRFSNKFRDWITKQTGEQNGRFRK